MHLIFRPPFIFLDYLNKSKCAEWAGYSPNGLRLSEMNM